MDKKTNKIFDSTNDPDIIRKLSQVDVVKENDPEKLQLSLTQKTESL